MQSFHIRIHAPARQSSAILWNILAPAKTAWVGPQPCPHPVTTNSAPSPEKTGRVQADEESAHVSPQNKNRGRAPGAASACYKTTPTRQCLIAIVFKVVKPYSASNPFSRP